MRETNNEGSYLERSEASVLTPGFFCVQGVNVMDGVHTMMQELLLLTIPDVLFSWACVVTQPTTSFIIRVCHQFCLGVYVCQIDKRISVSYSQHSFTLYTYVCSMCNFLIAKLLAQLWETEFVTVFGKLLGA